MKKRWVALLCVVALVLVLVPNHAIGAGPYDDIYLVGVNDTVLLGLITQGTMPFRRSGVIYAPYTVLDSNALGLSYALNRTGGTFTIYNRQRTLIFPTSGGVTRDKEGNEYNDRIITLNGVTYIPLRFVASFFGFTYSFYNLTLPDGTVPIARLCTADVRLDNQQFGAQAAQLVQGPLHQYVAAQAPSQTPTATPTPTPVTPPPAQSTPSQRPLRPVTVYLAAECTDGAGFDALLDALDRHDCSALFLFPTEDLIRRDDDVRRAAAAGHQIGLLLPGEEAEAAFREGNRLLRHILRSGAAQVAFTDGVTREGDWTVWQGNVSFWGRTLAAQAANLLSDLQTMDVARLTVTDSAWDAQVLSASLAGLSEDPYTLRVATETVEF